jgi:hypothetical protein
LAIAKTYRWRKATDINREYPLFELMDGGTQILDVGFTDEGVLEVAFNPGASGIIMSCDQLLTLLSEARSLAEHDR